ncbi:MAG: GGDEF domain-containing protein [Archangiaceae bacterium]|nr:GGDEF domain-containing protein [Archangiaceae bacterium]
MPKVAVWVDVAAALLAVTVIGLGDAWTDTRISLAVFHVVPIAVVAARHGLWPSVPVLIVATAASGMVDVMAGVHIADGAFILFWRTFDRLLVYVGAIVLLARLRHLYRQAEALARLDGLTGLLNQRAFKERCAEELRRCARHGQQLSVAVLDLDGFKAVNDTFGHAAGDDVLRAVGGVLSALRSGEVSGRLGGDEFGVVFPGSDAAAAKLAVERLLLALAKALSARQWAVRCSIGVASSGEEGPTDVSALLHRADEAMYAMKQSNRP